MLRLNSSMTDKIANRYASISHMETRHISACSTNSIYAELAKLTRHKQWVLYTANCPRPSHSELLQYRVNYQNIIHMKPSRHFTEEEVVIKAIKAGTASAVVASSELSSYARDRIQSLAFEKGCKVFFLSKLPEPQYH